MNSKQLADVKQQLKREIIQIDHQIQQLQGFYIQDTRQFGNLLKGFQNYLSAKTARNQPTNKKQKVQNYQRIFSLSSVRSKTSECLEETFVGLGDQRLQSSQAAPKRNRNRPGGMTKGSGKHMMRGTQEQNEQQQSNSASPDNMYSMDESNNKMNSKRKKITKSNGKGIKKI